MVYVLGSLVTLVVSAVVLLAAGALLPGFSVAGFWGALKAALVITILSFIIERLLGRRVSPRGRGLVAFLAGALVIYLAQYVLPGSVHATMFGALLASFVIGLVDAIVPTNIR